MSAFYSVGDMLNPNHLIAVQNGLYHDLYAISYGNNEIGFFDNNGSGDFDVAYYYTGYSDGTEISHYPVKGNGDFNFAVSDYDQSKVYLYTVDTTLGITWYDDIDVGDSPWGLIWADLDSDGILDLVTANFGTDSITILWGIGFETGGYFVDRTDVFVGTGSGPIDLAAADFNSDGLCDIVTANWGSQSLGGWINDTGRSFEDVSLHSLTFDHPNCLLTFDIDADGFLDLLVSYETHMYLSLEMGQGDGTFTYEDLMPVTTKPYDMVAADFNNNGSVDVAIVSNLDENMVVAHNLLYDEDFDGIPSVSDNCPYVANPEQEDTDEDAIGDVCDLCTDTDDDGYGDPDYSANICPLDNCPTIANAGQTDSDVDGVGDACTFEELTTTGTSVEVDLGGYVTLEFDEVTGDGSTELEITTTGPGTTGFTIVPEIPPVFYNITTTATFTGEIIICLPYDDTGMTLEEEQSLTIQHYENDAWINITYSVDTDANIICGISESLSPFVMAVLTYICGDANNDQTVNVSDAVSIINYVFVGGDPPDPIESGDCNCDDTCNVSDAVWIINYVFVGGSDPCDSDGDTIPDC